MKKNIIQVYARTLSQIITSTEDLQKELEPYYTKLKTALDGDQLAGVSDADLADIQAEFQDGTDQYKQLNERLNKLQAPARFMGKHRNLTNAYQTYVDGCQAMTDSIQLADHKVDQNVFAAAETGQNEAMDHIIHLVTGILSTQA
ncbi:hypothetical protein [Furfurilactobacillus siliginis]|uniref:Chemotaxis protein n=1 Tax=Furfurilactobacillus siliginis TaxID=348151 RepID=A0A510VVF0_9LACO|nr:hypothetical protein [Furfurilactobacillus siliginis]GEK28965.1 hypothetical protein LSI01_12760 [Furfurilactobacillus siliginis]